MSKSNCKQNKILNSIKSLDSISKMRKELEKLKKEEIKQSLMEEKKKISLVKINGKKKRDEIKKRFNLQKESIIENILLMKKNNLKSRINNESKELNKTKKNIKKISSLMK